MVKLEFSDVDVLKSAFNMTSH